MSRRATYPCKLDSAANMREHWAAKHKRVAWQRSAGQALALSIGARRLRAPRFVVTLTRIAPRALDDDNLAAAFKAWRDGVADAFGIDDRDPRIVWRYAQRRGRPREYAIEIAIDPVEMSSHRMGDIRD